MALTKTSIEKAQPESRDVFLWDDAIAGFGVRVLSSGKRSFLLQYRNTEGRSRRVTLGRFGVLTVQQARQKAIRLLAQVSEGADPAQERREATDAPTLEDLAARYLRDHAEPKKKPRSVQEDHRLIEKHILPTLGSRKVGHITSNDIDRLHSSMSEKPILANRVLALESMMFRLAEKWRLRPVGSNPCHGVERYKENRRERYLSMEEIGRLGDTLRAMQEERALSASAVAGIRLLLLTGCRRNEIRNLRWSEIDLKRPEIRLSDSKTGPRSVPLNAPAVQVIDGLERRSQWVLPGVQRDTPISLNAAWIRIRKRAGCPITRCSVK